MPPACRLPARLLVLLVVLTLDLGCSTDDGITDTVGPPATVQVVSGNNQEGNADALLPEPLVVRVLDASGRTVPNQPVTFQVASGSGMLSPSVVTTTAAGEAQSDWTLGAEANQQATATVSSLPSAQFAATVPVRSVEINPLATGILVGGETQLTATTRDGAGTVLIGRVVTWQSLNTSVASVDGQGLVRGAATGIAPITATSEGITETATVAVGSSGFALDFNDGWVTVPDHADLDVTTTWTLEAWIMPRDVGGTTQHVVSKWNGGGDASYTLVVGGSKFQVQIHDGVQTTQFVLSRGTLTNDNWQHIAATLDNGTLRLYINGALDTTFTGSQTPMNSTRPVSLGREGEPYGLHRYNGLIDEVRIWNVARTGAEIAGAMGSTLQGTEPGLVGYWRFDEGSGDTAMDSTGHGHNGQLGNAVGADVNDPTWVPGAPVSATAAVKNR